MHAASDRSRLGLTLPLKVSAPTFRGEVAICSTGVGTSTVCTACCTAPCCSCT